jgi:hypothetical protein
MLLSWNDQLLPPFMVCIIVPESPTAQPVILSEKYTALRKTLVGVSSLSQLPCENKFKDMNSKLKIKICGGLIKCFSFDKSTKERDLNEPKDKG